MARAALLFVLRLVVVSLLEFSLWQGKLPGLGTFWPGGLESLWLAWQMAVLRGIHGFLSLDAQTFNDAWEFARGYVMSVIPFLALMIAGGPTALRQRFLRGLYGLGIIGLWQLCTALILYFLRSHFGGGKTFFITVFPLFMFSYALPFVLWVLFSRSRIEQWLAQQQSSERPRSEA